MSRELDKVVAELMGYTDFAVRPFGRDDLRLSALAPRTRKDRRFPYHHYVLEYSTSKDHVQELLSYMKSQGIEIRLGTSRYDGGWMCYLAKGNRAAWGCHETGPLAVVRAFLRLHNRDPYDLLS